MKEFGMIEPSTSEWSSPIVIIASTSESSTPSLSLMHTQRIDDLLEKTGRAQYITTLDLPSILPSTLQP